jgi:hypothetical protein
MIMDALCYLASASGRHHQTHSGLIIPDSEN